MLAAKKVFLHTGPCLQAFKPQNSQKMAKPIKRLHQFTCTSARRYQEYRIAGMAAAAAAVVVVVVVVVVF